MSVAVYPRLERLLRERNLSAAELAQLIESRYGLAVDDESLSRLTQNAPIERPNLTAAGAAAAVLGVGLGELFDVQAVPVHSDTQDSQESYLDDPQSQRLATLFDRRAAGGLTPSEQQELDALVTEYGRRFSERKLQQFAQERGMPLERARSEAEATVARAAQRWRELEAGAPHRTARPRRRAAAAR